MYLSLRKSRAKSDDNTNQRPATTIRSSPTLWEQECASYTLEPRTQITKHCSKSDRLARSHMLNCHMKSVTLHSHTTSYARTITDATELSTLERVQHLEQLKIFNSQKNYHQTVSIEGFMPATPSSQFTYSDKRA